MRSVRALIAQHPVLSYYIAAFAVSWSGILLVIGGPGNIPGTKDRFDAIVPLVAMALLAGPVIAGLLMAGLAHGRSGYREFASRLLTWRVQLRWYAAAVLIAPLLMTAVPLAISLFYPKLLPGLISTSDRASLLQLGLGMGLMAGLFEELGWTGFAIPTLRQRHNVLSVGLIVGFLWGAWHLLINLWTSGDAAGALSPTLFLHSLIFSLGILPAYRVLMVWVYDRTQSLSLAMLMHVSLTFSNVVFLPETTGIPLVIWSLVLAAVLWVVVAVVARANHWQVSRMPSQGVGSGGKAT